jgi:CRISPR-associated protein Csh1
MLKELVQFTQTVVDDPVFRNLNIAPKEGLHIVLKVEKISEQYDIVDDLIFAGVFNKNTVLEGWLEKCAAWSQVAWMVDTNKCFDTPIKAIHSASPFCFAIKRTNLEGGEQYRFNQTEKKSQVYERIDSYFEKAVALLENEEDIANAEAFQAALGDRDRIHSWLAKVEEYPSVKDGEYVIFYLDLPLESYAKANRKYLREKLFNTSDYNHTDPENPDLLHGTSNWFNGFPLKKPFLVHKSATFGIAGRISSEDAQTLYYFSDLSRRNLFPNPLPLFIMADEREQAFKIFKDDAISGGEKRKGYLEIIEELWKKKSGELGNYYLIFMGVDNKKTVIKDFDFVSRFDFNLNLDGSPWEVHDLFNSNEPMLLITVADLMTRVLPPMFNNALVVRRKDKDLKFRWFDEIDPIYTKTHNAYLLAMKYRKAFYDFIYKSQRQSVNGYAIEEILMTGILDDIRLDKWEGKYNSENLNIRTKLNLLFSLHAYFSTKHNPRFMPENIIELRRHTDAVARGEAHLESDEQFAFAAGQVVDRISWASKSGDRSFGYLEPFLAQTDATRLKLAIANFFKRYKHANYSQKFQTVSAEVLAYPKNGNVRDLLPLFLAGVFSESLLVSDKKTDSNVPETEKSDN